MNLYILKIKRIVPLSVSLLWAATICYALLKWLFISQDIGLIKKEAWDIFIPLFLSLAIAFGVLGRRTRILPERYSSAVKYVLWITGTALLSLAQVYVSNKLAVTTHLHAIRGEEPVPLGRYYELDSIGLDLSAMSCYTDSRVMSRRGGSKLVFHAYVATPFSNQRKVWYVKHFQKKIKYTFATEEEVQIAYRDFVDHYTSELSQYDFGAQHRFERVAASDERDGYLSAVERALGGVAIPGRDDIILLEPFEKETEGHTLLSLKWLFGLFAIGLSLVLVILAFAPVVKGRYREPEDDGFFKDLVKNYFAFNQKNGLLALLPLTMILTFVAMTVAGVNPLSPSGSEMLRWGGVSRGELFGGAWWWLVWSLFVHAGIMHLFCTLIGLIVGLTFCRSQYGPTRILLIFLISGLCGSLAAVALYEGIYIGASGAIMGLMGAALGGFVRNHKKRPPSFVVLIWLGSVGLTLFVGITSGVSNTAHIAGLATGILLGLVLYKSSR